jgi:hypothetical protein
MNHQWTFEDYSRAYRFGTEAHERSNGRSFEEMEPELKRAWERATRKSNLTWAHAEYAIRDAWQNARDTLDRASLAALERAIGQPGHRRQ